MLAWAPSKGLIATHREQVVHVDEWWHRYAYVKAFRCQNCRVIQFEY